MRRWRSTHRRVQSLGSSPVQPGFLLHIDGEVEFLGFVKGQRLGRHSISANQFQITFALNFLVGPLSFGASGGAVIADDGFAMTLNVHASADSLVFSFDANGTLKLNTTNRTLLGVAGNTFVLEVAAASRSCKVIKFDASFSVVGTAAGR